MCELKENIPGFKEKYERIDRVTETLYRVWESHCQCGIFCIKKKVLIVPTEYQSIARFSDIHYQVWKNGKCGVFCTEKQSLIVPIEHQSIHCLSNALNLVLKN